MDISKIRIYSLLAVACLLAWGLAGCDRDKSSSVSGPDNVVPEAGIDQQTVKTAEISTKPKVEPKPVPIPKRDPDEYQQMVAPVREPEEKEIVCKYYKAEVVIDGISDEPVWGQLVGCDTLDYSSQRPITIKTFHDSEKIYFLVKYPDRSASREHKTLVWDDREQVYIEGNDREDLLVLKWSMDGSNMSFKPDLLEPGVSDVWFWKACRSDPEGYLDDKICVLSVEQLPESLELQSDKYGKLYLQRKGDEGRSCSSEELFFENYGPAIRKFYPREPLGSRADIKGKGNWSDGYWTIEFTRKLNTGNPDDVRLGIGEKHVFGVSLYEMAATGLESSWFQPLYRTGDVYDKLVLTVEPQQ